MSCTDFHSLLAQFRIGLFVSFGRSVIGPFFRVFRGSFGARLSFLGLMAGRSGPRRKNEDLDYRSLDEPVDEGPWHDGPLIVAWGAEEVYHTTKKSGSVGSLSAFTICCVQFRYLVKVQGCMSCTITEARRVTRCVRTS